LVEAFCAQGATNFSFQVQSFQDEKGEWHITGFKPSDDPVEAALKRKLEALKAVIRDYSQHSQSDLLKEAMQHGIDSRDNLAEMLKAGIGKHWIVRRSQLQERSKQLDSLEANQNKKPNL
jgi:hypothetical protein